MESDFNNISERHGDTNFWKPVRDCCNIEHITTAMRTSPAAARPLMLMDNFCGSEIHQCMQNALLKARTLRVASSANALI